MTAEELDQIEEQFTTFHAAFAEVFGRKQCRQRSQDYLKALLLQAEERKNAENLSEVVDASPRVLQRFLAETLWSDEAILDRLQEIVGSNLDHPEGVWAVDESGIVKQGKKSAGVARQYCGAVGKVANCQVGVFLAYVSPHGRLLVGKRLYLPSSWSDDPKRCEEAGVPKDAQRYRSKTDLALELLRHAQEWGHLTAQWVTGDDAYGVSPSFRQGVAEMGLWYLLDVPQTTPVWPEVPEWTTPEVKGRGRRPHARPTGRQEARERTQALSPSAWREVTVAEGAQGPRTYRFAAERIRESLDGEPGETRWLIHRENLDGSEPRWYLSNAPEETPLETLARVAASRWAIETEFQASKSQVGLDEYETRSYGGWNRHVTLCLLANAFLWTLERRWGEKLSPTHPSPSLPDRSRGAAASRLDARRLVAMARRDPAS
jgi:SRSO17 transposase